MYELCVYERVLTMAERALERRPEITGAELLAELRGMRAAFELHQTAKCKNCGRKIWRGTGRWRHDDAEASLTCWVASPDGKATSGEALPKHWKAAPEGRTNSTVSL